MQPKGRNVVALTAFSADVLSKVCMAAEQIQKADTSKQAIAREGIKRQCVKRKSEVQEQQKRWNSGSWIFVLGGYHGG
ncbi:MAG: hypothetical protein AAF548_02260, partial [Actinomycetota bacterium]